MSAESAKPVVGEDSTHRVRLIDTPHGPLSFDGRCRIMGILNVTPDSFSDGGEHLACETAVAAGLTMAADGADVLDIGGESTRPGSEGVSPQAQIRRVVPVIRRLREAGMALPISIDTQSAEVAAAALDAGADIVNDISGVRLDPAMPGLLAERGVPFIVMHMLGDPRTMQAAPRYDDVIAEINAFFDERAEALTAAGVDTSRVIVDPGIGFGKTTAHNLEILRSVGVFGERWPLLIGPSRKRFIGEILGEPDPKNRMMGTAAVVAHCAMHDVDYVRVHDVKAMRQIVDMCHGIGTSKGA